MKTKILALSALLLTLEACASTNTIDTSKSTIQIEESASAPDNRADAVLDGAKSIPQQVIARGYDLYEITDIHSDTVGSTYGAGASAMTLNLLQKSFSSAGGLLVSTIHSGEASLHVKMYHYGDKHSEDALDAREQLEKQASK